MSDAAKQREQRRMAAIRRCNHTVLSLRSLTDRIDPQELNELSSEALMRAQSVVVEIEAFRKLIFEA